jgi:hypothetical protein
MKKITLIAAAAVLSFGAFAQNRHVVSSASKELNHTFSSEREMRDTLMNAEWGSWTPTFYSAGSGYVFGNNNYGDVQKAQKFIVGDILDNTPHYVEGAVIWFGAKEGTSGDPTSKVTVKVYAADGSGTDNSGAVNSAPGTMLASADVLFSDIDTTDFTNVSFATPAFIDADVDYYISVDFSGLAAGDTTGIVTSADTEVSVGETTWDQWNDGSWYSIAAGWGGLDFVSFIAAAVDLDAASVNEQNVNGVVLSQNVPNPANTNTKVSFEITNSQDVTINLFDITGKKVKAYEMGQLNAGFHTVTFDVTTLPAGTYFYSLNGVTRRLAVIK